MGIVLAVGLMWMGLREANDLVGGDQMATVNSPLIVTSIDAPSPQSTPSTVPLHLASMLPVTPADDESAPTESVIVPSPATHTESATPQYVLDRISVTPASYEVARVYF